MADLVYYTDKMFTRFLPETDAGVVAMWTQERVCEKCGLKQSKTKTDEIA